MPELGSLGSVRGALSNARPYREQLRAGLRVALGPDRRSAFVVAGRRVFISRPSLCKLTYESDGRWCGRVWVSAGWSIRKLFTERVAPHPGVADMLVEINDEQRRRWFLSYSVRLWRGRIGTVALPLVDLLQRSSHERCLVVLG